MIAGKRYVIGLVCLGFMAQACGKRAMLTESSSSELGSFFENSERRDPLVDETKLVVNVGGCTGFFVANDMERTLIISARHCFNYSISNWCDTNGRIKDNDGNEGRCEKVIAADSAHDIALFEASLPYPIDNDFAFRLAGFRPKVRSRLQMIGYPVDRYRQGKLTVTENCWVLQNDLPSPHGNPNLSDRSAKHNCTTWGGNSGGPMFEENTLTAIGLPFTYTPGQYWERPAEDLGTAAYLAEMSEFVLVHREELEQAGVAMVF